MHHFGGGGVRLGGWSWPSSTYYLPSSYYYDVPRTTYLVDDSRKWAPDRPQNRYLMWFLLLILIVIVVVVAVR